MKNILQLTLLLFLSSSLTAQQQPENVVIITAEGLGFSQYAYWHQIAKKKDVLAKFGNPGMLLHETGELASAGESVDRLFDGLFVSARENGMYTGLASNLRITHTGAAESAVDGDQKDFLAYADSLSKSGLNLLMGGGAAHFEKHPKAYELEIQLREQGYRLKTRMKNNPKRMSGDRVLVLAEDYDLPNFAAERDHFLKQAWMTCFYSFQRSDQSYFIHLNNAQLGVACIGNDSKRLKAELLEMEFLLESVLQYSQLNKNTLILVVGTYEAGGLSLNGEKLSWTEKGITTNPGLILSYGPSAGQFRQVSDLTELNTRLKKLMPKTIE